MHRTRQRIQIGHQAVAQPHIVQDAFVGRRARIGDVPNLALRPLSVGTEERHESAELVPAGLEFLPFVPVRRVMELRQYAEAAGVHSPEGKAAHRIAQSRRDLHLHVRPGRADIAAPGGCRIALQARETVAGQQEHALVGIHAPLALIDGLGVDQGVGIVVFRRRAQSRGRQQPLHVLLGQAVAQVGFAGIHPPGVDLAAVTAVQVLVHLLPEQLPSPFRVGVIEGLVMPQPVLEGILHGMAVHIPALLQRLVVVRVGVELGPDTDHEAAMQGVHVVQHLLRIGIALRLEFVTPPLVRLPILPVLDDVVHGDAPAAEFTERPDQFFLGGIALPALPEAQGPLGQDLRLAGQLTIAADHPVVAVTADEVKIDLRLEFGLETDALPFFFAQLRSHPQAEIGHAAIRLPFNPHRRTDALFQISGESVTVGIPGRAPAAGHHFLATQLRSLETRIILREMVFAAFFGHQRALIDDLRPLQREVRQVPDGPLVLKTKDFFPACQRRPIRSRVGPGQGPFHSVLVAQFEDVVQRPVSIGIAPAAVGIGIEEQAIALRGHDKGNADLGVVLIDLLAGTLAVEFTGLVLTQAVEGFIGVAFEERVDLEGFLFFDAGGPDTKVSTTQQQFPGSIVKVDPTVGTDYCGEFRRRYPHTLLRLFHPEVPEIRLRNDDQARPVGPTVFQSGADTDDFFAENLEADLTGTFPM